MISEGVFYEDMMGGNMIINIYGQVVFSFLIQLNYVDDDDVLVVLCDLVLLVQWLGVGNIVVMGSFVVDRIEGQVGQDMIWGDCGNDWLNGGDGYDLLYGGMGCDMLEGGIGNDWLFGEIGNDILMGNVGVDMLVGGLGVDVFIFSWVIGVDLVIDFQNGVDWL